MRKFSHGPPPGATANGEVIDVAVRALEHGGETAMGRFVAGLSPAAQEALQSYLKKHRAEVRSM